MTPRPTHYSYRQISEKVAWALPTQSRAKRGIPLIRGIASLTLAMTNMYQRKDHFYKKAKKEGLASRAAYKLIEIQKKYRILTKGDRVLELGAAPGGWLEIIAKEIGPKGSVMAIDRLPLKIALPSNATFIQQNIEEGLKSEQKFDVILSDMSPDLSGISFRDTYQSFELAKMVWAVAQKYLKTGGHLVIKVFPGEELNRWKPELKKSFAKLNTFIPIATRKTSSEVYLVANQFKNPHVVVNCRHVNKITI